MSVKYYFTFIGQDGSIGYSSGKSYALSVYRRSLTQRLAGLFIGLPFNWRVIVARPLFCPYESIESFNENWKYEYASIEGGEDE